MGTACYDHNSCIIFRTKKRKKEEKEEKEEDPSQTIIKNDKISQTSEGKKKKNKKKKDLSSTEIKSSIYEESSQEEKPPIETENINNTNLINFMENNELRISFYENEDVNDDVYNKLKIYEKEKLKNEFEQKSKNYKEKKLKKRNLKLDLNPNIISEIINNEDSENIYKQKVINEIKSIKNNDSSFKIDYLTILVVGRKEVGKTTLINYILKLPHDENKNKKDDKDFVTYNNSKVPHLKLVEFKGIGLDDGRNPEQIGNDTLKYINNHIKNKNKKNYNDFVHCIWYCIGSTRFEKTEIEVLKKLKQAYKDNIMPIIVVYTQTIDQNVADKMFKHIQKQGVETIFVKVVAKDIELMDNSTVHSFGEKELLNKTLEKCTQSLKGEMISLMTQNISNEIKVNMLKINKNDEEKINKDIINNFIEDYKNVLRDDEFINYIINILVKNLQSFYKSDIIKISNASYNIIYNSDIINNIKQFISYYKNETKEIIKPVIESCAVDFIDKQAFFEKEKKNNIKIKNKKRLKGFKKINEIYLKKYFYYISQKYIINYIIHNYCKPYFGEFRKKFDIFIKNNLENPDEEIKYHLEDCFLTKLKKFAEEKNIPISINHPIKYKKSQLDLPDKRQINGEEELYKNENNSNSFDLGCNYNDSDNEYENKNQSLRKTNIKIDEWYPLKEKNWKYLNKEVNLLNNFLQKIDIQDSYFCKIIKYDEAFQSLKEYIKNDLLDFFNSNKMEFMRNKIVDKYNQNLIEYDNNPITKILKGENLISIYKDKIKNQFDYIDNNNEELKIDYLTIIVIGKSGAGKSTLINSMIMEDLAEEGAGDIVTKIKSSYRNKIIPFLRFIDTRGIELNNEFGPSKILKDTYNYIQNQEKLVENDDNYNNYIQCLWYCLKDNNIEQKEIEVIKSLKKNLQSLPLIIVSPNSFDKQKVNKMKKEISDNLGDIPFIPVLGKDIKERIKSYGRDDLLNKTLEICQNAVKGNVFNKIKSKINEQLINTFNDINKDIKININKKILNKFIQEFNEVLNDDKLLEFIFELLEINYIEYMKNNNKEEKKHLSSENKNELYNSKKISNFIKDYIAYYKSITKEIVEPILEDKGLEYLDIQVKKEIKEFKHSINVEYKNDKKGFRKIIQTFLNNNFYYISQKYIIYRLITDVCEPYSEEIENEINKIVKDILNIDNDANKWFRNSYYKKFEYFKEYINTFRHNGKIYDNSFNNNNCNKEDIINDISSPTYKENNFQLNCPEAPYPKLD